MGWTMSTRITILMLLVALFAAACGQPEAVYKAPETTVPVITSTTTQPSVTTTTEALTWTVETDVLVVGDSIAAAGVLQAIGDELDVLWIPETGYTGGQAAAAGVSSMDEQDVMGIVSRDVIPYSGLVDAYRSSRHEADVEYGRPYFGNSRGYPEYGPSPLEVRDYLDGVLADVEQIEFTVADVLQEGNVLTGVIDADGNVIIAATVVDATEFQDLYPMIEGLSWEVAECVQNTTWTVVRQEDSTVYPRPDAGDGVRAVYGDEKVDGWLEEFRAKVSLDGRSEFEGWGKFGGVWSPEMEWEYRAVSNGYSHVNNNGSDSPMTAKAITDIEVREAVLLEAKARMFLFMWYQRYELGVDGHGFATDLGYQDVDQLYWSDAIPDELEKLFTPFPYIREARTLSDPVLIWSDIKERDHVGIPEGDGLAWGYRADSHGCGAKEQSSGYGLFIMGYDIFVQDEIVGFYPAMARGARVDAVVASSVRMQPSEYIGGFMVGELILDG